MAQRKKGPSRRAGHRLQGAVSGLSGPVGPHGQTRVLHSVETHPQYQRRLDLGPSPSTAAEFDLRPFDRSAHAAGGHHADVRQGRRRPRRSGWPRDSLRDPLDRGAVGDRLRSYVRVPYRARIPMTRAALMHRDRFRCAYCGAKADTVDHVVPRSRGGDHSWENCVAACSTCNHRKADHLLTDLGWTLRSVPVPPKGQHWRLLSSVKELDPAWVRYLGEVRPDA